MAGKPIATVGSMHVCPMCTGIVPHVGGPIAGPGAPNVLVNNKPVALMGDMCICVGPPDVVAQGNPLVKVNGVPVVCVGDLTAHGGVIMAGEATVTVSTAVATPSEIMPREKIPFPTINFVNKAIASLAGNSLTEAETNIETLANLAQETPVPDDSEVTLETTFPQDQLQYLAQHETLHQFLENFITIFGQDVPCLAYEQLYHDAKENAAILAPTLIVKQSIPYGGKALFYHNKREDIQEIWVGENFVRQAAEDNNTRGELLAALVEEFGHWVDYLLRNHYAETERPDAFRDEGAYFSYRMLELNKIDQKDQLFAHATIDGTAHDLLWDYEPYHNGIKHFVNQDRWNNDDHFGPFEFYKAGFLDVDKHGEYAHGNIERIGLSNALKKSGLDIFLNLIDKKKSQKEARKINNYLLKIYFGNWKRDFSQGLDPFFTRLVSNTLKAFAHQSTLDDPKTYVDVLKRFGFNALKTNTVTTDEQVNYKFNLLGINVVDITFKPVDVAVKMISTFLEMLAVKEFVYNPKKVAAKAQNKKVEDLNYAAYLKELRENFTPIDKEHMGVYIPAEHIDNPKVAGVPMDSYDENGNAYEKPNDDITILKDFMGSDTQTTPGLHDINMEFGMKNYIRNKGTGLGHPAPVNGDNRYLYSHTYILDKLKKACKAGGHSKQSCQEDLGAALHTLEDYFAHSNYAEIALIKEDRLSVFPWVSKVTFSEADQKKGKVGLDYLKYLKDPVYKEHVRKNPEKYDVVHFESTINIDNTNRLAAQIPIVTGTFELLDTAASLLPIVSHAFDYDKVIKKRTEKRADKKKQKEEKGSFYFADKIGQRTFPEILVLELLRDMTNADSENFDTAIAADTEDEKRDSSIVKEFIALLQMKDTFFEHLDDASKQAKEAYEDLPDEIKSAFEWLRKASRPSREWLQEQIDEKIDAVMQPYYKTLYNICIVTAANLNDAQVLLQSNIDLLQKEADDETWNLNIGMNPTHTQVAKDDPHHPMHSLSALLAVDAVEKVGTAVFNVWNNGGSYKEVEKVLNGILMHPAQTKWQTPIVQEWLVGSSKQKTHTKSIIPNQVKAFGRKFQLKIPSVTEVDNAKLVCHASTPSVVIDRLLHTNKHIEPLLEELEKVANKPEFLKIENTVKKEFVEAVDNANIEEEVKKTLHHVENFEPLADSLKKIRLGLNPDHDNYSLSKEWHEQFPGPLYCRIPDTVFSYKIQSGDSLSEIAKRGNTTVEDLLELNPQLDPVKKWVFTGTSITTPYPVAPKLQPLSEIDNPILIDSNKF